VSLTLIPGRRGTGRRRAIDRLTEQKRELAELQQRLDDADALILRQATQLAEREAESGQLAARLRETEDALINVGKDRDVLERYVRDLESQLADAERRLDVRTWAEAAATKTQPIPVITRVLPLHEAPFATTKETA
jgi:DNA repair exonuclease SbcCD ATPase subunit